MSSVWTLRLNLRSALSMDSPSCSRISAKIYHLISPAWDIWSLARMIRLFALNAALQRRMMAAPYSRTVGLRPRLHYGSGNGDADRGVRLEGSRQNLRVAGNPVRRYAN
jgi:hypothetical protein